MANIQVGIKFRPKLSSEVNKPSKWTVSGRRIKSTNGKHNLVFDNVFDARTSTQKLYNVLAQPIVAKSLEGYNGTVLVYGETASGKTFSMIGDDRMPGIIPLALKDIFGRIRNCRDRQHLVRIGFIEIYNDKIYDLFDNRKSGLKIIESNGTVIINQREFTVETEEEVFKYFNRGNKCKRIKETSNNTRSSRSHTIFRITIESQNVHGEDARASNLFLVDLAGSEKPDDTTKSTFNEGLYINKSLLALGIIIREVSKKKSNLKHVNFRECKLTRILSPALGGNSLTSIICTVSPTVLDETYHTICFAQNAKTAKTYPTYNHLAESPMPLKKVQFEALNMSNTLTESSMRRRKIPTPVGSENDLRCPKKKPKISEQQPSVSGYKESIVLQQSVFHSLKCNIKSSTDGKIQVEGRVQQNIIVQQKAVISKNNEIMTALRDRVEASEGHNAELKEGYRAIIQHKDNANAMLETKLKKTEEKLLLNQSVNKMLLKQQYDLIDLMTKNHEKAKVATNLEIKKLKQTIELFEKSVYEKEIELRSMESRVQRTENEKIELKKNFELKFKEFLDTLNTKDETIKLLKERIEDISKKSNLSKLTEMQSYYKLDEHYSKKYEEARNKFEALESTIQQKLEEKIDEHENRLKKLLRNKDDEIMRLNQEVEKQSKLIARNSKHESIGCEIAQLKTVLDESLRDLRDLKINNLQSYFTNRLTEIFNEVRKLIKKMENNSFQHEMSTVSSMVVPSPPTFAIEIERVEFLSPPLSEPSPTTQGTEIGLEKQPSFIKGKFCKYCDRNFSRKAAYERHLRIKHLTHEQVFQCDDCGDNFATKSALNSHKSTMHRDRKSKRWEA